ncbi:MAG: hypothetical protein PVI09_15530 [Anaerolineae bacterium]|jgi:hypothetical protein
MRRKQTKRNRQARSAPVRVSPDYRRNIRQADDILANEGVEVRADNWQELALEWFAPEEPERGELARYIADHERKLGIPWA